MSKPKDQLHLLKEIVWRPGVVTVLAIYGFLQLVSNFIAWLLPVEEQAKYQFAKLATWKVWLVGTPVLTLALIALIIRSALRVIAQRDTEHLSAIQGLKKKYLRRRRRINKLYMKQKQSAEKWSNELYVMSFDKSKLEERLASVERRMSELSWSNNEFAERLKPQLEILFGQEHPPEYPFIERTADATIYRIAIKNTGGSTLSGVVVKMDGFSIGYVVPNNVPVPYNDLPLRARHETHPRALSIPPGEKVYLNVVRANHDAKRLVELCHSIYEKRPTTVYEGIYHLTFRVTSPYSALRERKATLKVSNDGHVYLRPCDG
jgi:hypothetical protein